MCWGEVMENHTGKELRRTIKETRRKRQLREFPEFDEKDELIFQRMKRKKMKKKKRRRIIASVFFLLFLSVVIYFISPVSRINVVLIEGNKAVPQEYIKSETKLKSGASIFWARNMFISKALKNNPFIEDIHYQRIEGNIVKIILKEKRVVFKTMINNEPQAFLIDGTHITIPPDFQVDAALLLSPEVENFPYAELAQKFANVPEEIMAQISEIKVTPSEIEAQRLTLLMKDGNRVIILMNKIDQRLKYYFRLVEQLPDTTSRWEFYMEYTTNTIPAKKIKE